MIHMISSANFKNSDAKAIHPADSSEPEKDDFAALLEGLSFVVPPVAPPPVNLAADLPPENSAESSLALQNFEMFGDGAIQSLPQFEENIAQPDSFAQALPKEFSLIAPEKLFGKRIETNADTENEISSFEEIKNQREPDGPAESESLLNQIEDIQTEFASEESSEANLKEAANQFRPEMPGGELSRNETPNKLPKLFREVSSFFEVTDLTAKNQPSVAEVSAPVSAEGANVAAQIEPQIAQMIAMAVKTQKPQILKMRLNPAELGGLEIKIEKDEAGRINAHFRTEKEETRKILTENIAQLRDSLQDSGWQIDRVEVSCDANSFAGNEARENSSQAEKDAARNSFANTNDSGGQINTKEDLNSEKSNRLLSVRA